VGPRPERLGDSRAGCGSCPNPSGLNAHYGLDRLTAAFADLRAAADASVAGWPYGLED
jgi:TDG/mug DNA glycosylase family protein